MIPQRRMRGKSVDDDDMFVFADLSRIETDQFVGQIGIDAIGIEQFHAIGEPLPFFVQLRKLDLPLIVQARIIAPCEQAVGTEQRITRKIGNHKYRKRRCSGRPQDIGERSCTGHEPVES